MRKLFLLFAGLIMTVSLFAQEVVEYGPDVFIDIDGIEIGDKPSREELAKHFGISISDECIEVDLLNYYRITYDGVIINVEEAGTFCSFILESSEYPVMTLRKWKDIMKARVPSDGIFGRRTGPGSSTG